MEFLQKVERPHPFKKDKPGYDWWVGFLKRWPKLSERKPQHLSRKRAEGANRETVDAFFTKVAKLFDDIGIRHADDLPDRLWNCDESGLCNASTSSRILAKKGARWVHDVAGGSGRGYTTIHGCGSASGVRLPPYIIYKGKNLYSSWTKGGAAGALYAVSNSGWMENETYESWFQKMFIPAVKHLTKTRPVVLFFDGHYSHISIRLIEISRENNIHLVLLPSNTTHVLQPLDVGVYGPLKQAWKKILADFKRQTRAANISKEEFPNLVAQLWSASFKPQHLQGGFRESGLFPFRCDAIPSWKVAPALPLQATSPGAQKHPSTTAETPLRTELRKCFIEALKPTKTIQKTQRKKIQLIHYGEALTSDETLERLKEEEEEKKKKKQKQKGKKSQGKRAKKAGGAKKAGEAIVEDDKHCQICGAVFEEEEEDGECLGCDECWRWVHYYCAGFDILPEEETEWLCPSCSD